eukprot:TRINITY_DN4805_c0_g1_i3.p1 TRINITY_DN4805_c0_g1~~TRINITY_DN4805_c0_g1_i3.p1  ORF type:complete len:248 (-),score=50.26 TRINITY_DN4805_c0_g1_i3:486-1229(-)
MTSYMSIDRLYDDYLDEEVYHNALFPYESAIRLLRDESVTYEYLRSEESEVIRQFLSECDKGNAGTIYVSGVPGTGKTMLVKSIVSDFRKSFRGVYFENCAKHERSPNDVFKSIYNNISGSDYSRDVSDYKYACREYISSGIKMLLILDEVDHLLTDKSVLYEIFEWKTLENSQIAIITIANGIDLINKDLKKLQEKNTEPIILNFQPYTKEDLIEIIKFKLTDIPHILLEDKALEYLAGIVLTSVI